MHHRHYSFNSIMIAKALRKHGRVKNDKRDAASVAATLGLVYREQPQVAQTMECMIHADEYLWLSGKQTVYFLEDCEMAYNIQRGSYNMKNCGALYQDVESFVMMMPPKFSINGREGGGVLVTILRHQYRQELLFNPFFKAMGLPAPKVYYDGDMGDFTLCIDYQEQTGTNVYMRAVLPSHILEDVMHMETVEQYAAHLAAHNKFNFLHGAGLAPVEQAYQFGLLRLIGGFLIYKHALPERIREGLPSDTRGDECTNPVFKNPHMLTVRSPKRDSSAPQGHYRAWHFRQLMADRYYQGEHAAKARGSRIVFVSDSFVGGKDVDAHTATKAPL